MTQAELVLSLEGAIYLDHSIQATEELSSLVFEKIHSWFLKDSFFGLLHLGIEEFHSPLPPSFLFWQLFSRKFISQACKASQTDDLTLPLIPLPSSNELEQIVNQAFGMQYLTSDVLVNIWENLTKVLQNELRTSSLPLQKYLKSYNPEWNVVGRICFHLAENKKDEQRPFAFLATYTTKISEQATAQHVPLKKALQDYAGEQNSKALLTLLTPVQKAAEKSPLIKKLVDNGSIFQAQTWTAKEAYFFLQAIPLMEASGVVIRVPNWWNPQKPPRPKVKITLGENQNSTLTLGTLLDFNMELALSDGKPLSKEEWQSLLKASDNLVKIKDTWVEIDREKLESVLSHWETLEKAARNGLSIAESMKLLAGIKGSLVNDENSHATENTEDWSTVIAGSGLQSILKKLKDPSQSPEKAVADTLQKHLQATLRPYQIAGVQWLNLLYELKLGGCLADDMGLGKTIQILSLLLLVKHLHPSLEKKPHLLIVPASLLGNWLSEAEKFAPNLKILVAHSSVTSIEDLKEKADLSKIDFVITTYTNVYRVDWFKEVLWDLVILDEAQLIKNPGAKQTCAVKKISGQVKITLSGTPVENKLGDLWSLFDFSSPGLLGSNKAFSNYVKKAGKDSSSSSYMHFISTLRKLTKPYILRRMKTDKSIISDLPDKMEMQSYCSLSKDQIQLYKQAIQELSEELEKAEGIKRQGLILAYLLRFKQICNHPAQWLGYGEFNQESSGKFIRLQEICEEIAAKREKVLIFTQFREIIPPIASFLSVIFGREGLVLHGETVIKKRKELVEKFQQPEGPPFFVLSLKAGGTGLTLTQATHVIHFDRWWNPAVENQATDRAYRIGQKHPVLVHKFICRGTIEEKIDELITSKKNLSKDLLYGGEEIKLTELSNNELLNLLSLDLQRALGES